ncbi:MAG: PAS domain-containing sensor histidine kinase [Rhodocyclales bacterium RIFCSPLOWO2_02_FULL_63_24]|nr:MAG: PAS domain-containing sensor histidine kinase [Rhodocyclales bacterium GWA2_65_19]OHC70209.1 MAG: PAS domain-containing sensor histidine kinase [Rhodocyclales bacterium RIFCSPLOWO2_02_FULL_63_24]
MPKHRSPTAAAGFGRIWLWNLPYIAIGIFAVAMLTLVWVLQKRELDLQQNVLARDMQWAEQTMRLHLQGNQEFLGQLARELAEGVLDRDNFQIRATQYIANNPELVNIAWVDAGTVIRWTAPFETTDWISGEMLAASQPATFSRARDNSRPSYGAAYEGIRGVATVELFVPVQRGREHRGAIVGVYSVEGLVNYLVPNWFTDKYRLSIEEAGGKVLASNSAVKKTDDALDYSLSIDPPGNGLVMHAVAYRSGSEVPRALPALLIFGLTLVVVWSLTALRQHVLRRVQVEKERDRLFNLSLDMLCITGLDGVFRRVNPAFERILGYAAPVLVGRPLLDFVHLDEQAETRESLRQLALGQPVSFERRCRCDDGRYKWLVWSINPVPEEGLLYAVAHDITDRKRGEEALRAEYAFRKAMGESLVTGLRAVDLDGRIIYVNPAFCRMTGWTEQELIGVRPPFPYWPPEELDYNQHNIDITLAGQAPAGGFEIRVQRKNGERFDARLYVSPLIDSSGRQTGWMASMNDITEPKRARAELEAAHERFVAVLDGLDTGVYVAAVASDEILYANRAFKNIHGFDAVGRNCWQVTAACRPDPGEFRIDPRQLGLDEVPRELFDGEIHNTLSGRWYHLRDRAIRWVDGRVVRMEIATDITERKLMEEAALKHQERLEQTAHLISMGEMASTLAHELNQPLAAIANYAMGCVNRLERGDYQGEAILDAMRKASFQAERAGKIVRRMRDFVRKSEPHCVSVPLADIVDEVIGFAEMEARKAGVDIRVDISPGLPPVRADRIMIEQVLLNLVKNGIEAMAQTPRQRRHLTLAARCNDEAQIEIEVRDNGHGIDTSETEKLFAPFFTTKPQGMGMGLNICRTIIEFHNGRLWAAANPGGGSVFRFTLPLGE